MGLCWDLYVYMWVIVADVGRFCWAYIPQSAIAPACRQAELPTGLIIFFTKNKSAVIQPHFNIIALLNILAQDILRHRAPQLFGNRIP